MTGIPTRLLFSIALMLLTGGCATIINGTTEKIPITTDPNGVTVNVDGQQSGVTPVTLELSRKQDHELTFTKPGYETTHFAIKRETSGAIAGNILLGGLIGLGVDAADGSMNNLVPSTVFVKLNSGYGEPTYAVQQPPIPAPPLNPSPPPGPRFQPYTIPSGQAVVYVYRLGAGNVSEAVLDTRCDSVRMGTLGENGYAGAFVSPGPHSISAETSEVAFTAEAGKAYYIAATVGNGLTRLSVVSETEGKASIASKNWFGVSR